MLPECPSVASFPVSPWGILNLGNSTVLGRWRAPLWLRKVTSLKGDSAAWGHRPAPACWVLAAGAGREPVTRSLRSVPGGLGVALRGGAGRARGPQTRVSGPNARPPQCGFPVAPGLSSWCGVCLPHPVRGDPVSCGAAPCQRWQGRPRSWGCFLTPSGVSCVWRELSWLLVRGLRRPALLLPGLRIRAGPRAV